MSLCWWGVFFDKKRRKNLYGRCRLGKLGGRPRHWVFVVVVLVI